LFLRTESGSAPYSNPPPVVYSNKGNDADAHAQQWQEYYKKYYEFYGSYPNSMPPPVVHQQTYSTGSPGSTDQTSQQWAQYQQQYQQYYQQCQQVTKQLYRLWSPNTKKKLIKNNRKKFKNILFYTCIM
jgi:hypothetical protein